MEYSVPQLVLSFVREVEGFGSPRLSYVLFICMVSTESQALSVNDLTSLLFV